MKKIRKVIAKTIMLALVILPTGSAGQASAVTVADWNTTNEYVVAMEYLGAEYPHDMTLIEDSEGDLSGGGGYPAGGPHTYTWVVTSGTVLGDVIHLSANYTASADAVTPQTVMHMVGTIASDGTMSGTWSDNYQGGVREGTWSTTLGTAVLLSPEDFGVVSYDTGLGMLKGYTAGFGLTNATFENVETVVVQLFAGNDLLQTNTATAKVGLDITGNQISSPFDVSGTFDYVADGYWTNVRESQYGQSVPATKVVATVTLSSDKVVTAENAVVVGDPATIYPVTPTPVNVRVTILKFIDGAKATGASAHDADFPMTATWNAGNIGAGSGEYALSEDGFNGDSTEYQAITSYMTLGADYSTKEKVNGPVVGAQCAEGKHFALDGYTTGDTYAEAASATPSMSMPEFIDMDSDKYVIVWNQDCSRADGHIGGTVVGSDGFLEVTSIDSIDVTATANGTFTDGWEYVFHVTAPMDEQNVSMKFSDWLKTGGGATIPVANNMRISSAQADNGGATILLTASSTYATPPLHMTGDLNLGMDGRQVEITVEVAVPSGIPNGAYTTDYGVQSTL